MNATGTAHPNTDPCDGPTPLDAHPADLSPEGNADRARLEAKEGAAPVPKASKPRAPRKVEKKPPSAPSKGKGKAKPLTPGKRLKRNIDRKLNRAAKKFAPKGGSRKGAGRPAGPEEDRRAYRIQVSVTIADMGRLTRRATIAGHSVAEEAYEILSRTLTRE